MNKGKWIIALAISSTFGMPIYAQTKPAAKPAGTCAALKADFDRYEKNLASNMADGLTDNSVPRATLRAMEDNNTYLQASMTIDLMKANSCALPPRAPDAGFYFGAALTCSTARMKGIKDASECNRDNWSSTR